MIFLMFTLLCVALQTERAMYHFGHSCIDRSRREDGGAVSIAELLIVIAVSSILFLLVMNGQEFVSKLSQKFFDMAVLESEARMVVAQLQNDLGNTEKIQRLNESGWLLIDWHGDTLDYHVADSSLIRNDQRVLKRGVNLLDFDLVSAATITSPMKDWLTIESTGRSDGIQVVRIVRISLAVEKKGERLDIETRCNLQKRAPGT